MRYTVIGDCLTLTQTEQLDIRKHAKSPLGDIDNTMNAYIIDVVPQWRMTTRA